MTLWDKRLALSRRHLIRAANTTDVPNVLLMEYARMFLNAYHKGPWRTILALTKYELISLWGKYGWAKWEWIRTRVFRRAPHPVLLAAQRVADEEEEIKKLGDEL